VNFLLVALAVALIRGAFASEAYRPLMFQFSFLVAILVFFSVASAKRDDYILPGIPSLAILFAALFTSLRDVRIAQRHRGFRIGQFHAGNFIQHQYASDRLYLTR
jgi:4-amino-4-deoxy-L-arabinose transferase-like glycosyltransferase